MHEMCTKESVAQMGARDVHAEPSAEERRMPRPVPTFTWFGCLGVIRGRVEAIHWWSRTPGPKHTPRIEVTMNCEPALAVMSAKFSRLAKELWMAAREAEAERKQTFLP